MTIDTSDLLNSILGSLSRIDYIKPEEVPNIPLYMDQVKYPVLCLISDLFL